MAGSPERRRNRSDVELRQQRENLEHQWNELPTQSSITTGGESMTTTTKRRSNGHMILEELLNVSRPVAHDDIARRAYQRYEERGKEPGHDVDDWLHAERELRQGSSGRVRATQD